MRHYVPLLEYTQYKVPNKPTGGVKPLNLGDGRVIENRRHTFGVENNLASSGWNRIEKNIDG